MTERDSKLVWGAQQIGDVINRPGRAVYHLLSEGRLPAQRVGNQYVARRDELLNPASWPRKPEAK